MILEFLYIPHRFKYINKAFLKKISKEKISFYNLKKGFSIRNNKLFYLDQCIKGNIRCETFHQSGKFLIISYINKLTTNLYFRKKTLKSTRNYRSILYRIQHKYLFFSDAVGLKKIK